jgi:hypothetical protein
LYGDAAEAGTAAPEVAERKKQLAAAKGIAVEKVLVAVSDNEIIKEGGNLPQVFIPGENHTDYVVVAYETRSSLVDASMDAKGKPASAPSEKASSDGKTPLPSKYATAHFYADRADLRAAEERTRTASSAPLASGAPPSGAKGGISTKKKLPKKPDASTKRRK